MYKVHNMIGNYGRQGSLGQERYSNWLLLHKCTQKAMKGCIKQRWLLPTFSYVHFNGEEKLCQHHDSNPWPLGFKNSLTINFALNGCQHSGNLTYVAVVIGQSNRYYSHGLNYQSFLPWLAYEPQKSTSHHQFLLHFPTTLCREGEKLSEYCFCRRRESNPKLLLFGRDSPEKQLQKKIVHFIPVFLKGGVRKRRSRKINDGCQPGSGFVIAPSKTALFPS